jgi:hypothetical protein
MAVVAYQQDNKSTVLISLTEAGVNITAHTFCRRIRVQENYTSAAGATTDLAMQEPKGADDVIVQEGTPAVFTAPGGPNGSFYPGQIVGVVKTAAGGGTVQGQQIEDQLV